MEPGSRVRLKRDVERYPHFVAPEGLTGTVVECEEEIVSVRLDEPVEGAEEWDNQVHWYPEHGDPSEDLEIVDSG